MFYYKNYFIFQPRLGPKPFTPLKLNETDSFEKVFSVPLAPVCHTNGVHERSTEDTSLPLAETDAKPEISDKPEKPPELAPKYDEETPEQDAAPKTPSTAERRKLFETTTKENDITDATENNENNFERNTAQRTSIAERRKMYETRSQSVQEGMMDKPDGSPSPLRRKDSFKSSKNDENAKNKANTKQNDAQIAKKDVTVAPTPKRTSTVFGNYFCTFIS